MSSARSVACGTVDELAAAFSLGAVDAEEERAVSGHLATCARPHAEAHALAGMGLIVAASLDPVAPSERLRSRVMSTIAQTRQDHVPARQDARRDQATAPARRWWQLTPLPSALAAVALTAAVGIGAWGLGLQEQLRQRDAAFEAIASADTVHPIAGEAGSGLLLDLGETAAFVAEDLADLPADRLYQFWLIDAQGNPVPAGTLDVTDGVALVNLDRGLEGATTFAVTVEQTRVEAPTSAPVLAVDLGA
jgi:anti-sigma factor RsiW